MVSLYNIVNYMEDFHILKTNLSERIQLFKNKKGYFRV